MMVETTTGPEDGRMHTMYVRQFGYSIAPGQEEKAVALCADFVQNLRTRGVRAYVLVGGKMDTTLQMVEEYASLDAMHEARKALDCDESYRGVVSAWASEFYPLVRSAAP